MSRSRNIKRWLAALALLILAPAVTAQDPPTPVVGMQNGRDIYQRFHDGLAEPECPKDSSSKRWRQHFDAAPRRLSAGNDDTLALFGYVVDALREANMPTEYALIPFVESRYQPGARSPGGPAGMWQMIAVTARNHHVPIRSGYDGRLSPVDSTRAAVRYLKTLHGMFAGDWRLAVMAYNAGEYRVFAALKRSGQVARNADPEKLVGLSSITRAYVRKLHALSCLLDSADDDPAWLQALDRPVPVLQVLTLPPQITSLNAWLSDLGLDPSQVRRLNPAYVGDRIVQDGHARPLLAPVPLAVGAADSPKSKDRVLEIILPTPTAEATPEATPHTHTVARGESAWTIAHRYGLTTRQLLLDNGLTPASVLQPGMVLQLGEDTATTHDDQDAPAGPEAP